MNRDERSRQWSTESGVKEDVERDPHLFLRLAENSLTVAESLRDNYVKNSARFFGDLRKALVWHDPPMVVQQIADLEWSDLQGEVATFIDGGVGQVQISARFPVLVRVGSYTVRTGERRLSGPSGKFMLQWGGGRCRWAEPDDGVCGDPSGRGDDDHSSTAWPLPRPHRPPTSSRSDDLCAPGSAAPSTTAQCG